MSVKPSKRKIGKLAALTKTRDYVVYTIHMLTQEKYIPKRYRWSISGKIIDTSEAMYINFRKANEVVVTDLYTFAYRTALQSKGLEQAQTLYGLMDIAEEIFHLDANKILAWTDLLIEAETVAKNWQRRDIERYNEQLKTDYTVNQLNSIALTE